MDPEIEAALEASDEELEELPVFRDIDIHSCCLPSYPLLSSYISLKLSNNLYIYIYTSIYTSIW